MERQTEDGLRREGYVIRTSNDKEKPELLELQCRNCGGFLELVDRTHAVCPYCGQKYLIDEAKGTIINVQVDYSGSDEMVEAVNSTKKTLIVFLIIAAVIAAVVLAFNIAARMSVFSSSDEDGLVDENGILLRIFCKDIFGKEYEDITEEEFASVKYIRCAYEREGSETFNVIFYSFTDYQDCESQEEFQETIKKWTYRTKMVSWPSDYTMFTGLTRIDNTDAVWLSLVKFSPDSRISYVDTDDRLDTVANVLNPEYVKVLHIGIMGNNLQDIGRFKNLEELDVDTNLSSKEADISGISQCSQLKSLRLRCGEGYKGLENLKDLKGLKSLYIDKMPASEWGFLKELPQLEELSIYTGEDADLSALEHLSNLKKVNFLDQCYILPEELEKLRGVEDLTIAVNQEACLEILGSFDSLKALDVHMAIHEYQVPVDVSPLAGLKGLEKLYMDNFWGCQYTGVEQLLNLPELKIFRLGQGAGSDAELLMDMGTFSKSQVLEELGMINCTVTDMVTGEQQDFGFVAEFPGLKRLYLDECGLEDISFVSGLKDLRACSLMGNDIMDLSPLLECKRLGMVSVDKEAAAGIRFPDDVWVNTEAFVKIYE